MTMATLGEIYDLWQRAPLPKASPDSRVDELHGLLQLNDEWVWEEASSFLKDRTVPASNFDLGERLRDIQARVRALRPEVPAVEQDRLDAYDSYLNLQMAVHEATLGAAREDRRIRGES